MEQFFHGQLFSSEELQELDSIVWPYEDFFSSNSFLISDPGSKNSCLIDPKESFEPVSSSIYDERLADSFFQIDPRAQFEGSICPNEEDGNKCTEAEQSMQSKRKFRADECSNDVAVPAASCSKKFRGSLSPLPVVEKTLENPQRNMNQKICDEFYEEEENEISSSPKDDGSTVCREFNGGENEISSKLEASDRRGATAESQSLYARKRREKISERLKILQNLVPNGTKVDTSTMLEEAVQYVKFLQLQIKILSSDELWMYAPLAYNGVSIGVDLMIPSSYLS